jgi:peptidoglycan hydrolase-like protein with peptidoglycan-binding domain
MGNTGGHVAQWQKVLNALHAKPQCVVDGNFGPATTARTQDLQKLAKITPDGIAGPATYLAAQFFMALGKIDINKL